MIASVSNRVASASARLSATIPSRSGSESSNASDEPRTSALIAFGSIEKSSRVGSLGVIASSSS